MTIPGFDWRNPDYAVVNQWRLQRLQRIRAHENPGAVVKQLKAYYRVHPADFISDWGITFDPRNAERDLPTVIPFVLFPKQREFVDFVMRKWREQRPGLCEKSRDMGISWLSTALACTMCLHYEGVAIGFGSRLVDYVDKIGTMKPLLPKARMFMQYLPEEFRGGWQLTNAPFMRINFPETGSLIMGEGGDQIGRGDRATAYMVDEAAYLERPELVEHSLSQTTNCRIDMSSVNGMNNPFAKKRHEGKIEVFVFDWHDDPRKDDAWYAKQCEDLDPVTVAQEIDRDYSASVAGIVIPGIWARAALGAREKLGHAPAGRFGLALDIADEGTDKNAMCGGQGIEVSVAEEWSGKGSDTFHTVERAFEIADEQDVAEFIYDSDGLGALVRGDARVINDRRRANNQRRVRVISFRSSEKVYDPDGIVEGTIGHGGAKGRTNKDYFANRKAQGWWHARKLFRNTYRAVVENIPCSPDEIISIDPKMPNAHKLVTEISQATYSQNNAGKIIINKKPDGMKSPNLADGVVMRYAPNEPAPMEVTQDLLQKIAAAGMARRRRIR